MAHIDDLYRAIDANDVAAARTLLCAGPDLANSVAETPPPIHWAIYQNRPEMVEVLLEHGADLSLRDRDRQATPLDYAVVYARAPIVRLLVARGADAEGGLRVALKGASGGYEEFEELPGRAEYESIAALLRELGAGS